MKPHITLLSWAFEAAARLRSMAKAIGMSTDRRRAGMDVPDRVAEALVVGLGGIGGKEREVVVDRPRDHVEIEPLGRPRLLVHEQRQALGRGIGQPLVDGEAVPLRLRDLLAVLVEEELVVEAIRGIGAEHPANLTRQLDRVDQVLARHLVVDAERRPAERPVGLPLALDAGRRSPAARPACRESGSR